MKKLYRVIVLSVALSLFLGVLLAQSQQTSQLMYWNSKNLEMLYAKFDTVSGQLMDLYYKENYTAKMVKLQLKAGRSAYSWQALNPRTKKQFEVSEGMTLLLSYPEGTQKEFLYAAEYINDNERIIVGYTPVLGNILYQKGNAPYELWLSTPDETCKASEQNGEQTFRCEFVTPKGEKLKLMIDETNHSLRLWRNSKTTTFYASEE